MDDYLTILFYHASMSWNMVYFMTLSALLIITVLIIIHVRVQKKFKELALNRQILTSINTHLQWVIFRSSFDSNRTMNYLSENILAYTGYSAKSLIQNKDLSYFDIIHHEDRLDLLDSIRKLTNNDKRYQIEYRIRTKWGTDKWIMEEGTGIFNKKGQLTEVEGIITDITDSKTAVEFLKESEERFQVLIEKAPVGIWISYNTMITYCNPICLKLLQIDNTQEIIGSSLLTYIAKEKRDEIDKLLKVYNLGLPSLSGYETIGLRKDGSEFPMQIFLTTVDLGDFKATLTFLIDITERKQSEEKLISLNQRLNDIIDLIPDPTFVVDKDKKVTHWNKATEELTGIGKEEIIGKDDYAYSIPFYGAKRPMLVDFIDSKTQVDNYYSIVKRINGKVYGEFSGSILYRNNVHLWGVAAPLYDSKGNHFGAIEVIKDVSESKKHEEALIASERKARIVLDTNQDVILLVKPNGTILECNTQSSIFFRKQYEDLIGTNCLALLPVNLSKNYETILLRASESGNPMFFEHEMPETSSHYNTTVYPVKNDDGKIRSLVVCCQDITRLKNAEKALKESEEHYRTITESISDFVYKMNFEKGKAKLTYINPKSELMLGYTPADFKSDPELLTKIIVNEDKPLVNALINKMLTLKKNTTLEHRVVHKNGKIVWISNSLIYVKEKPDKSIEYNGVINDITLRKHFELTLEEAEERYRSVFDQSGLASSVYDLSGKLIMQNALASSLFGGTSSGFIGKNIDELLPPLTARDTKMKINETLNKRVIVEEKEVTFPTGKYWLKTTTHTVRNSMNEIIGVQFISQDISEKKELDRIVINTIIDIEEKERMKFAQELHDGLGPLISAIKMYIQWLSRPDAKITQSEILTDIEKLINDASQTIREISFNLSPHILNNFGLIEALNSFAEKIQLSKNINIDISTTLLERLDITTETVLYRIICECINNTVKHANASVIKIRIKRSDKKLKISYIDDGKGFDLEKALEKKAGSGLFNMQSRLQSINGYWIINSVPEQGTKIMITIRL